MKKLISIFSGFIFGIIAILDFKNDAILLGFLMIAVGIFFIVMLRIDTEILDECKYIRKVLSELDKNDDESK